MIRVMLLLCVFATSSFAADAGKIEFNRDIRPLFSKHCTACHGGVKAAGNISFVYRDKAIATGKSGEKAIVPGKPQASELIKRVTSTDPDEVMPKPDHEPRLSEQEVATLTKWIEQGAVWTESWAFEPPVELPLPKVNQTDWPRLPMDRWVLAKLEAEGLAPSKAAAPAEWLRRVSLDLTGLPPTLEDAQDFLHKTHQSPSSHKPYEEVVDRLLKSPHSGERWASMWLDLARYSDTFGFEKDPHRDIWPWRDWVIRAFNADLPFDQFTIKQLAGDLLPNPSGDNLLATAFHRNTQNNTEGGTDDEEYRTAAVIDRVNTTWTAWQATTFGCVMCHSHPYDPFPHRDFYRFAAFFNSTEDTDLNDDFPRLPFPDDAAKRDEMARLAQEQTKLREKLNADGSSLAKMKWQPWSPKSMSTTGGELKPGKDARIDATGTLPIGVVYTLSMPVVQGITALRLDIFPDSDDPKKWPERGSVLSHLKLSVKHADGKAEPVKLSDVFADFLAGPFDPQATLTDDANGFGGYPVLAGPRWCVITLDKPLPAAAGDTLELVMEQKAASNSGFQGLPLRHFQWSISKDERWPALATNEQRKVTTARLNEVRAALNKIGGTNVPVMVQRSTNAQRATRVFTRGNRLAPDELVEAGIPELSRPPEKQHDLTRLDMARWLVSDRNTLTARVLANRLWAEMFGRGIVETLEDFGTTGARPTHPELLDHLALRLRTTHKWSVKTFLREIALSATYAQSSKASLALIERDPKNTLYARGPRTRLTAEMVRDQALVVSGLFAPKMFGPPVYPPQPEGVWNSAYSGAKWNTSTGEDRYRRALYTYAKRTSGYPAALTFDAPTRDACTARRIPTNTPLQALVSLNDPAFFELAQAFAKRMTAHGTTLRDHIEHGCQLLTLTKPSSAMVETLIKLHDNALKEPGTDEANAMALVANTLLNMDAVMVR
ncbi:MAG: PSD1 and planctomycete cytochrome C domain-containing protein [Verrucomicrobiaceae bacterium]|nr:PSD1 and planctomycete cytochrome C domain-containing protein [Verrucomicrobiaceae bacterium]